MPGHVPTLLFSVLLASVLSFSARAEQDCVSLADQLEQSGRVTLDGVRFDFDRALLRPDSIPILLQAREVILAGTATWIIEGHTDNVGSAEYNQRLSRERAEAVVGWLAANGVDPGRLSAQGYGPDQPVADNASETGRALNRRVELVAADRAAESASLARRQELCAEIDQPGELDGEATLSGPESAVAGSEIEVQWQGPDHANDYITVVETDAPDGRYRGWSATRNGSPARFAVPDHPGTYELRYVLGGSGKTLARQAIEITPASASLQGPAQIGAGSAFDAEWTGPDNYNDYITIVAPDAPEQSYLSYHYTRNASPATLSAPVEPGLYELRYVTGRENHVLARQAIEVTEASASVSGPTQIGAGSAFEVEWTGPANQNDFVTIVAVDAPDQSYLSYHYARNASPASLRAPDQPGAYELRYVTGQSNKVLARLLVEVVEVSASVNGPEQAAAGSTIEMSWTGPNNNGDYLTIVPAGTPDHQYTSYVYTRDGSPVSLRAPNFPGSHELRYVSGQNTVLARQVIELTEITASVSGPGEIIAGSTFEMDWTGPANQGDFVTIVQTGASDSGYLAYSYATSGTPVSLRAPAQAGSFELRYVTGHGNRVLARQPVTVVAAGGD